MIYCHHVGTLQLNRWFQGNFSNEPSVIHLYNLAALEAGSVSIHNNCYNSLLYLIFSGGYESFSSLYPNYISHSERKDNQVTLGLSSLNLVEAPSPKSGETTPSPAFPIEVIENLYLGNHQCSMDSTALARNNIRYILNVTPNLPNHFEGNCDIDITYKQIPIQDHWSQNLSAYFPEAIAFIGE